MQAETLRKSRKTLMDAVATLKTEYVGLDEVIDHIADAITPWFLMPDWHTRPVIVNLWGMTGTGKTSLVKRLCSLIGMDERTYTVGARDADNRDVFGDIRNSRNGERVILIVDEFQHFRTINEELHENRNNSDMIWDILDSGRSQESPLNFEVYELAHVIRKMRYALDRGTRVENGIVISHRQQFIELMEEGKWKDDNAELWFFPRVHWSKLGDSCAQYLIPQRWQEFAQTHSANEIIEELQRTVNEALKPKEIDCSKALVFVIGNLDEAYAFCRNMRNDLHADAFHHASRRIHLGHIKNALLSRFRPEQVARLGNTHIIYPALSADQYKNIIAARLLDISQQMFRQDGLQIEFDISVHSLIYQEGVYPAQGVRPLLSTIHGILLPTLAHFALYARRRKEGIWHMRWDDATGEWVFMHGTKEYRRAYIPEAERAVVDDPETGDKKLIAVHEAGHVMGLLMLYGVVPEFVYNSTHGGQLSGEVHHQPNPGLSTLQDIIDQAAVSLGGWVAEGLVYGDENRTLGSENDLRQATGLLLHILKTCGADGRPYSWRSEQERGEAAQLFDAGQELDAHARKLLDQARARMEEVLLNHSGLFRAVIAAIHDKPILSGEEILHIVKASGYHTLSAKHLREAEKRDRAYTQFMQSAPQQANLNTTIAA